jgi:hypothetical protein
VALPAGQVVGHPDDIGLEANTEAAWPGEQQ